MCHMHMTPTSHSALARAAIMTLPTCRQRARYAHPPELQSLFWLITRGVQQRECMETPRIAQRLKHLIDRNSGVSRGQSSQLRCIAQLNEKLHQQRVDAFQQLHPLLAPHLMMADMASFNW